MPKQAKETMFVAESEANKTVSGYVNNVLSLCPGQYGVDSEAIWDRKRKGWEIRIY